MRRVILSYNMVNEHVCTNILPDLIENGISVEALRCAPTGPRSGYSLVRIRGPAELCEEHLTDIENKLGRWCSVQLSKNAPGDYVALVTNRECDICHLIADSGCFVESAKAEKGGNITWTILSPDADAANRLIARLRETGRKASVHSVHIQDTRHSLTWRQLQILHTAFNEGYYDIPQRTNLEMLAALQGCSKSTLNIILRRAERKVLAEFLSH